MKEIDTTRYLNTGQVDMDGNPVVEGHLLRYRHPSKGLKYSNHLYPIVFSPNIGKFITDDDIIVTTEFLKQARLYVFSHISIYEGNLRILNDSHVLKQYYPTGGK